ncbi:MAG: protein kinase [Clostridium sp.]
MVRTYGYSADFDEKTEKLFRDAQFLGEGHNGIVYEVPGNRALKIFQEKQICNEEAKILLRVKKSKYFPTIMNYGDYYILRDKIDGERLDHYIKKHGLSKRLGRNIMKVLKEFKKLNFTKLDARCRDLYVTEDEVVKVIDPKQCYKRKVQYPRHLMKGLDGIEALDDFLDIVKEEDFKLYRFWKKSYDNYKRQAD